MEGSRVTDKSRMETVNRVTWRRQTRLARKTGNGAKSK